MALHGQTILLADVAGEGAVQLDAVQVDHRAAVGANKVTVGSGVSVEPLLPVHHAHALHLSLLLEKDQVAIDGAQAQVGVGGL